MNVRRRLPGGNVLVAGRFVTDSDLRQVGPRIDLVPGVPVAVRIEVHAPFARGGDPTRPATFRRPAEYVLHVFRREDDLELDAHDDALAAATLVAGPGGGPGLEPPFAADVDEYAVAAATRWARLRLLPSLR